MDFGLISPLHWVDDLAFRFANGSLSAHWAKIVPRFRSWVRRIQSRRLKMVLGSAHEQDQMGTANSLLVNTPESWSILQFALNDAFGCFHRYDSGKIEAGSGKKLAPFLFSPLATSRHEQHLDIEPFAEMGSAPSGTTLSTMSSRPPQETRSRPHNFSRRASCEWLNGLVQGTADLLIHTNLRSLALAAAALQSPLGV